MKRITTCITGLLTGITLCAAQYTVRPGEDLNAVNRKVKPGDTVLLKAGRHTGMIVPGQSGTAGKPITYKGEKGTVLYGKSGTAIRLNRHSCIVISGMTITAAPGTAWFEARDIQHVTVKDMTFLDAADQWAPFWVKGAKFCRFENLTVDGCLKTPARLDGRGGFTGANLMDFHGAEHCVFSRIHTSRGGHTPFAQWPDCKNNAVRDCVFDSRWARNFEFFNAQNILIERCAVVNAYHGASSADTGAKLFIHNSIFRHNLVVRNADLPLVAGSYTYPGFDPFSIRDSRFYNNTFSANGNCGFSFGDFQSPKRVVNNVFKNNIFCRNNPGGDPVAIVLNQTIVPKENPFRGNVIFGRQPGDNVIRSAWPVKFWSLAAAAKDMPEMFTGNCDFDPQFVNPARNRFDLQKNSPAIDQGEHLTFTRSAGSGKVVEVQDARYFFDGFGIPGEPGDLIVIGGKTARVTARDVAKNTLTLDRYATWKAHAPVDLPYAGKAPDPGAYEYGMNNGPAAPEKLPRTLPPDYACDFEPEHFKDWAAWWFAQRQGPSSAALELREPAAKGKGSCKILYVFRDRKFPDTVLTKNPEPDKPAKPSALSCFISPPNWNVKEYPFVTFFYRIPQGVPVGLNVSFFPKAGRPGRVYLGGSPAYTPGNCPASKDYTLTDDGKWHEITLDLRKVLQFVTDTDYIKDFGFRTEFNGKEGQCYWFDEFRILPAERKTK